MDTCMYMAESLCCPSEAIRTLFICSVCLLSHFGCVWLFATLWTVACQAPLSMEFSSQEYWSGLPCPPAGYLPDPGIKPTSLMSPALASRLFTTSTTWEVPFSAILQRKIKRIKKNTVKLWISTFTLAKFWPFELHLKKKKFFQNILPVLIYLPRLILLCAYLWILQKGIMHYGLLCVCPPSHLFNALSLMFIHVLAWIRSSFLFVIVVWSYCVI